MSGTAGRIQTLCIYSKKKEEFISSILYKWDTLPT